jgi:hypothetical protein
MLEYSSRVNDLDFPTGAGKSIQSELRARFLLRLIYLYSIHAFRRSRNRIVQDERNLIPWVGIYSNLELMFCILRVAGCLSDGQKWHSRGAVASEFAEAMACHT